MSYWTYRSFDNPLKAGEEKCRGEKIWTCYERRGYYRETSTNLGGVLGVINYDNSVPTCNPESILVMRNQMSQMDWSDQYIIAAISLFRDNQYETLINELPNLASANSDTSFHIVTLFKLLDNSDLSICWDGGLVNGSFWLENKDGERIMKCYVNFRSNSLGWDREDQTAVLKYLREHGGRFLQTYIGEPKS